MKSKWFLFILLYIVIQGCAHSNGGPSCPSGGTALDNGQSEGLVNGACNITQTPGTLDTTNGQINVVGMTMCGEFQGFLYQNQMYTATPLDPQQPLVNLQLLAMTDDYYLIPQPNNIQCWYNITKGQIDPNATPPTF